MGRRLRDEISQAFSLHICMPVVLKYWTQQRSGNEARDVLWNGLEVVEWKKLTWS